MVEQMQNKTQNQTLKPIQSTFWIGVSVLLIGLLGLSGWIVGLKNLSQILSIWPTVSVTNAFAIILCGIEILLLRKIILSNNATDRRRIFFEIISSAIAVIIFIAGAASTYLHTAETITLGPLSAILHHSETHRMQVTANLLFMLAGLGFMMATRRKRTAWIGQLFPCVGLVIVGLIANTFILELNPSLLQAGLPTLPMTYCVAFGLVFFGTILLRSDLGMLSPFSEQLFGGNIIRRKAPFALLALIAIVKLIHEGAKLNYYNDDVGMLLFVTVFGTLLFFMFHEIATSFNDAHKKLKTAEFLSEKILDICPGAITIMDLNVQKPFYIADKLPTLLGYTHKDCESNNQLLKSIIHPDDCKILRKEFAQDARWQGNAPRTFDIRCRHKDGTWRTLLTSVAPFSYDANGHISETISCALDITHVKSLQKDLETSNRALLRERENLLRSNKDLEIFAASAAHDLKSPLQSAASWLKLLRENMPSNKTEIVNQSAEVIDRNISKSITFINDLLTISRLNGDHSPHVTVDIKSILDHLMCVHASEIQAAGAKLESGFLPPVLGNPNQIECVLSNLIRNALNYRDPNRPLVVKIGAMDRGDHYEFFVHDTGVGIPKDKLQDVFELFHRLHNEADHTGTGMGLAYCHKAINLHGGQIWVESEVGAGSTFKFSIPKPFDSFGDLIAPGTTEPYDHLRLDSNPPISQYVYNV